MTQPVVLLEKVSKSFGTSGVHALDSVDLEIGRGETIAITGPSGSGKSTLLNMIAALDVPTSGKVLFEGRDLVAMSDNERTRLRREKIGMVFQTFNLMPTLTAVENVSLPLRLAGIRAAEAAKRSIDALTNVGLESRLNNRPDELSGGERQRVAIARGLIFGPSLVLADEPTGNLDSVSGEHVLDLLDEIHERTGTTIVLVTHNEEAAARCRRHIRLRDGRIASNGAGE